MQSETLGKMLPRILFPYVQQWAERSGMTLLSRLLVDEQFRGLLEKYGDEVMSRVMQPGYPPGNGYAPQQAAARSPALCSQGSRASPGANDSPLNGSNSLAKLQERVCHGGAETVLQSCTIACGRWRWRWAAARNAWWASTAARSAGARAGSPTTRPTSHCWRRRSSIPWPHAACRCGSVNPIDQVPIERGQMEPIERVQGSPTE
jgi:hypothetical protein